jgi:hypothetical protein
MPRSVLRVAVLPRTVVVATVIAVVLAAAGPLQPASADLNSVTISKSTTASGVQDPGDTFTYRIEVDTVAAVERLVVADGAFDYPQMSITNATMSINGGAARACGNPRPDNVWCAVGSAAAGTSVVVTVSVQVHPNVNVACDQPGGTQSATPDTTLRNIAKVRWEEGGVRFTKDSARVTLQLNCAGYDPDAVPVPAVTILSGPSSGTTSTSATISFTSTPSSAEFRCALDGGSFVSCTSPKTYTNLGIGAHYVDIQGRNATGWGLPTRHAWTIANPFTDIGRSIFRNDILWLYSAGITGGCATDRFCPTANVTREQMASFLARALKLPTTSQDFFSDDNSSAHEGDINRLAAAGITGGCDTGRFCPRANVTREQMASFLVRALKLPGTSTDFFTDDETSIHESSINRLAASGVTGGCGPGRYCPRANVTREQMAAFLHRGLTR